MDTAANDSHHELTVAAVSSHMLQVPSWLQHLLFLGWQRLLHT